MSLRALAGDKGLYSLTNSFKKASSTAAIIEYCARLFFATRLFRLPRSERCSQLRYAEKGGSVEGLPEVEASRQMALPEIARSNPGLSSQWNHKLSAECGAGYESQQAPLSAVEEGLHPKSEEPELGFCQ
jgi:hypothetical protein